VNDENASPLAGSIPQVNDENTLPLAENVPPRRVPANIILMRRSTRRARGALQSELSLLTENIPPKRGVPENIALVRRSTRRATAALHGEPISVLEIRVLRFYHRFGTRSHLLGRWKTFRYDSYEF
jgi:hypothetical protein